MLKTDNSPKTLNSGSKYSFIQMFMGYRPNFLNEMSKTFIM